MEFEEIVKSYDNTVSVNGRDYTIVRRDVFEPFLNFLIPKFYDSFFTDVNNFSIINSKGMDKVLRDFSGSKKMFDIFHTILDNGLISSASLFSANHVSYYLLKSMGDHDFEESLVYFVSNGLFGVFSKEEFKHIIEDKGHVDLEITLNLPRKPVNSFESEYS